jgi:hypothetical protein
MATMTCTSRNIAGIAASDWGPCCGRPSAAHRRNPNVLFRRRAKRRERQQWKRQAVTPQE